MIGARFFKGHAKIEAVDVKWHPESLDDAHVVVLTTDNILR